ncbi:MAG: hypothetical protein R3F56_06050 [Planctomycetota bacterium]
MAPGSYTRRLCALAALVITGACGERRPSRGGEEFVVQRHLPDGTAVFMNQRLAVYFSEQVDPLSVTPDTVRVVDREGHPVAMERLEVGSQVVYLHPRAPLTSTLDDGSFVAGRTYVLDVAGYPRVNAVRARSGRVLERGIRIPFRVVSAAGTAECPRPLLPLGEPFTLDPTRRLEVQADSGVLRLHFTAPPFPPSVRPGAFLVHRLADTLHEIEIASASVLRDPTDPFPGCSVELLLRASPPLALTDQLWLSLVGGDRGLVDYAGHPLALLQETGGRVRHLHVRAGSQVEVAHVTAGDAPELSRVDIATPGFEVRDGRLVPRVRIAAGSGVHGVFAPRESVRLGQSEAIQLAGGRVVWADATLELSGLEVPAGVRLTIGGFPGPVRILVTGSVRIAGEVVLETVRGPVAENDGPQPDVLLLRDDHSLTGVAGCVILAAGDVEVTGRVTHVNEHEPMGSPLALVAGGRLMLQGRVPPGTVCACEGEMVGDHLSARIGVIRMRPGYSGLIPVTAEAHTPWVRVPAWAQGAIVARPEAADPGIEVLWQTAPADSIDADRADRRTDLWSQPRPVGEDLVGVGGQYVRFLLRARVEPGVRRLPGLRGVTLSAR